MSLIRENRENNDPRKQVQINVPPPPPPTIPTGLEADPSLASQLPPESPEPTLKDVFTPAPPSLQQKIQMYGGEFPTPEMQPGFEPPPDITQLDPSSVPQSLDLSTTSGQTEYTQPDFSGAPTVGQVEQVAKNQASANLQAAQTAAYVNPAANYIQGGMPRLFEGATAADLFEWQQKFGRFVSESAEQARRNLITESFQPQATRNDPSKPNFNSMRNPITSGGVPGMINNVVRRLGSMFEPSDEFNPWAGYQQWWRDVQENPWKIITAPFVPLIASTQGKYGEFGNGWWGQAIYVLSLPENIVKGGLTDLSNLISGNQNPESKTPNIVQALFGQNYDFSQDRNQERPLGTIGGESLPRTREELEKRSWLYRIPLSGLFEKTPLGIITGGDRTSTENLQKLPEKINIPLLGERPTVNVFRTSEFIGGLVLDAISGYTDNAARALGNGFWRFLNPGASPTAPKPSPVTGVTNVPDVGTAEWKPINIQERYTKPTQLPNNTIMAGSSGRVDPTQVPIPNQQAIVRYESPAPTKLPQLPPGAEQGRIIDPKFDPFPSPQVIQGEFVSPDLEGTVVLNQLTPGRDLPKLPASEHRSIAEEITEAVTKFFPGSQQAVRHELFHTVKPGGALATIPIQGELVEVPVGKPIVEGSSTGVTNVVIDAETVRPLLPEAASQIIPSEVLTPPKPPSQIMKELQALTPGQRVNSSALVHVPRSNEELTALARFMGDVPPTRGTPLSDLRIEHLASQYPPGLNPYARYGYPIPVEKLDAPNPVVQVTDDLIANVSLPLNIKPFDDLTEFFEVAMKNNLDRDLLAYPYEKFKATGNRDVAVLDIYQNGTTYQPINAYLRDGEAGIRRYLERAAEEAKRYGEPFDLEQEITAVNNSLRLLPDFQRVLRQQPLESGVFYRGIGNLNEADIQSFLAKYKPGTEVEELGFTATSSDPNVAKLFLGDNEKSVFFEIEGTAHRLRGEDVKERVFPPGSRFKVTDVDTTENTIYVRMTQVSPETVDAGLDDAMRVPDLSNPEELDRVLRELPDDIKSSDVDSLQEYLDLNSVTRSLEVDVQQLSTELVELKNSLVGSLRAIDEMPNVGRRNALDAPQFEPSKPRIENQGNIPTRGFVSPEEIEDWRTGLGYRTTNELKRYAAAEDIPIPSRGKKEDIIEAIVNYRKTQVEATGTLPISNLEQGVVKPPDEAIRFADAVLKHEEVGSQTTNRAIFLITKGDISDDLQKTVREIIDAGGTDVREKLIQVYSEKKLGVHLPQPQTTNLPSQVFYHGSKVRNLDLNSIDPIVGSARHELGVGLYLTDNLKHAEDYALATPHRNLPPIEGREFDEIGQVFSATPKVRKPILANELPPKDVHEAFLKTVAESFDEEVNRAVRKALGVSTPKKSFREYYTTVDSIIAKVAGNVDFPESEVLQFQRIVADKLRVLGYDSILDRSNVDNVLVLLNPETANAVPIKQIGSGSLMEQAAARFNAASTTAARFDGKNQVLNTISAEANVSLQTHLTQQLMEHFDNASKKAEDASRRLIEQERLLRQQAQAEAPKRRSQARKKYDAQNQNQIRKDSSIDINPCI